MLVRMNQIASEQRQRNSFLLMMCPVSDCSIFWILPSADIILQENPEEFFKYNFGYDIVKDSTQAMQRADANWQLPKKFFEKEPVAGVYP